MKTLMTLIVLAAFTTGAMAQDMGVTPNLDQGTCELSLDGYYNADGIAGDDIAIGIGIGHFVADNVEVGVLGSISDNDALTTYSIGGFGELNFPSDGLPVVPFVGAALVWTGVDLDEGGDDDAVEAIFSAGAKHFLTSDLAVALQGNFSIATEDIYVDDGELDDSDWDVTLGLRYYWDR